MWDKNRMYLRFRCENQQERDHWEDLDVVGGKIISRLNSEKYDEVIWA
jgi:hypothetical protein